MPSISVLLPVYRAIPFYLELSISSVMLSASPDLELIVGFDGPAHDSLHEVVDRAMKSGVLPIREVNLPRQGLVNTLNALIAVSDSKYIARQDSDDFALPTRFSRQLQALDSVVSAGFCGTQICRCDVQLIPYRRQRHYPTTFRSQLVYASLLNNPIAHPTLMLRRSALDGLRYRDVPGAEDWQLYVELWQRGVRSFNLDSIELLYRTHPAQITAKQRDGLTIQRLQRDSYSAARAFGLAAGLEWPHRLSQTLKLSERLLGLRGRLRHRIAKPR